MLMKPMPISELKPADYNPRKDLEPGDPEYEKLKRSLTEFGYVELVVVNAANDNTVISGHQRLSVLKHVGQETVDCVVVELDEMREKALNVAMNKISGEWDESKLALLIAALEAAAFVERRDIWTVGRHRLVCGDATSQTDVEALMDGKRANLVLTDPPYRVAYKSASGLTIANDALSDEDFYDFLYAAF